MAQNPLAPPPQSGKDPQQDRWMYLLWRRLTQSGQILLSSLDFSGSNLTDLQTRNHNDLQNLNAGDYVHLTAANHTDLTDGGATTLHKHDHGGMDGLSDDDHPQYLLANGTRSLSADWDAGSFEIRAQTFESDVITGTAPLVIASTTKVINLNSDLLDDQSGSYYLDSGNFTGTNWTDLTDAGATTLHKHDHGGMDGLADDDHAQYLLASDATNRATFASNWTDLTDGGVTSLHSHSGGGAAEISNLVTATTTINADTSVTVVSYLDISGDLVCSGNLSVT